MESQNPVNCVLAVLASAAFSLPNAVNASLIGDEISIEVLHTAPGGTMTSFSPPRSTVGVVTEGGTLSVPYAEAFDPFGGEIGLNLVIGFEELGPLEFLITVTADIIGSTFVETASNPISPRIVRLSSLEWLHEFGNPQTNGGIISAYEEIDDTPPLAGFGVDFVDLDFNGVSTFAAAGEMGATEYRYIVEAAFSPDPPDPGGGSEVPEPSSIVAWGGLAWIACHIAFRRKKRCVERPNEMNVGLANSDRRSGRGCVCLFRPATNPNREQVWN